MRLRTSLTYLLVVEKSRLGADIRVKSTYGAAVYCVCVDSIRQVNRVDRQCSFTHCLYAATSDK